MQDSGGARTQDHRARPLPLRLALRAFIVSARPPTPRAARGYAVRYVPCRSHRIHGARGRAYGTGHEPIDAQAQQMAAQQRALTVTRPGVNAPVPYVRGEALAVSDGRTRGERRGGRRRSGPAIQFEGPLGKHEEEPIDIS
jgi:hypothetical protein